MERRAANITAYRKAFETMEKLRTFEYNTNKHGDFMG
jgi:hypothetical protein